MDGEDAASWNVRLRQERIQRNWRQRDVAEQLGSTVLTVYRWEQGHQQPSAYFRIKLSALFGKSAEELGFFPAAQSSFVEVETEASRTEEVTSPSLLSLQNESETHISEEEVESVIATTISQVQSQRFVREEGGEQQNRARLLRRLGRVYREVLEQALSGEVRLELGFARQPNAVQNATHLLLRMEKRAEQILPPGTSLLAVYEEAEEELLILGEPGAGKSTLLLDLAQQLLQHAEEDETRPLPVIVPLASWAKKRQPLDVWLSEQICQLYDIPRKLSERWIDEQRFVPLLDGLDEMEEVAHVACIIAINSYHREHIGPLVVSSRTSEYEIAAERHPLTLQSAVMVQPLSAKQVDEALMQAGPEVMVLHQAFRANPVLQERATTPLLVNILLLTYRGTTGQGLPQKGALLNQQIWTDYVQRMVEHKGKDRGYPLERMYAWLGWLAYQMRERNQSVFYLEHLQPEWLTEGERRTYTWIAVQLPAIVIGMFISMLLLSLPSLAGIVQESVLGCFLGGLWCESIIHSDVSTSWKKAALAKWKTWLAISIFIGLCFGLSFGFKQPFAHSLTGDWWYAGLFFGGIIGLSSFLLQALFAVRGAQPLSMAKNKLPTNRWQWPGLFLQTDLVRRTLLVAVIYGLIYGLVYGLGYGQDLVLGYRPEYWLIYGMDYGLNYGLNYGLVNVIIGLLVGLVGEDIHLPERLKWTRESLKKVFLSVKHLLISLLLSFCFLLLGLSTGLLYGILYGLIYGLVAGLSVGAGYWILFGLFQGIAQERIEDRDRSIPNQGIRRALQNSVRIGVLSAGMLGIIGFLGNGIAVGLTTLQRVGLSSALRAGLSSGPNVGIVVGVSGGWLVWLLIGGVAIVRHVSIRYLLWRRQTFPWQAILFLDDATACILLRRVGGGYSFVHRQLLDHFADRVGGRTEEG